MLKKYAVAGVAASALLASVSVRAKSFGNDGLGND